MRGQHGIQPMTVQREGRGTPHAGPGSLRPALTAGGAAAQAPLPPPTPAGSYRPPTRTPPPRLVVSLLPPSLRHSVRGRARPLGAGRGAGVVSATLGRRRGAFSPSAPALLDGAAAGDRACPLGHRLFRPGDCQPTKSGRQLHMRTGALGPRLLLGGRRAEAGVGW